MLRVDWHVTGPNDCQKLKVCRGWFSVLPWCFSESPLYEWRPEFLHLFISCLALFLRFFFLINRSIDQRHRLLFASLLALYKVEKLAEGGLTKEEMTLLLSGILTIAFTNFTSKNEKTQKFRKNPKFQWHLKSNRTLWKYCSRDFIWMVTP